MIDEAKAGVGVAVEGVNQAKAALAQAEAGVIEAQGRVAQANIVKPRTESSVSQRDAAEADIHQLEENVRQAELQLSYTKIVAPEDGRITKKAVEEGSYLQPGQIVTALVPSEVWVIANFKETQLEYMKPGQEVSVKVDAYGDQAFSAKVDSIQRGSGRGSACCRPRTPRAITSRSSSACRSRSSLTATCPRARCSARACRSCPP